MARARSSTSASAMPRSIPSPRARDRGIPGVRRTWFRRDSRRFTPTSCRLRLRHHPPDPSTSRPRAAARRCSRTRRAARAATCRPCSPSPATTCMRLLSRRTLCHARRAHRSLRYFFRPRSHGPREERPAGVLAQSLGWLTCRGVVESGAEAGCDLASRTRQEQLSLERGAFPAAEPRRGLVGALEKI